ncbi:hypothetical protein Tco_0791691 [Tanacetum coccineum]
MDAGTNTRTPMLEKQSYVSWSSWFLRFLDGKKEEGVLMRNSIESGPFKLKKIPDARAMWNHVKRLMQGTYLREQERHSRLMNEFDKFSAEAVYDYDDDYQGEVQGDSQEDKLSTTMMLLTRAITQHFLTPTNNRLRTSSNTRNQAVIQDGRVDIQSKNCAYAGNGFQEPLLTLGRRQQFSAINAIKKSIILESARNPREDQLEELNASLIMIARIQPTDNDSDVEPTYDSDFVSENVQIEAENQHMVNKEMKKKNALITKELETYKERVRDLQNKPVKFTNFKTKFEKLKTQCLVEK